MLHAFSRTELLVGTEGLEKLRHSRVAVFGIGGVGGHAAEALARSGLGALEFFDHDTVSRTNLNRQLVAKESTLGQLKVEVMCHIARDINPAIEVIGHPLFFTPENSADLDFSRFDYIIDAIDTVTAKVALIQKAYLARVPLLSSMGAGNKLDPTAFRVADITKTQVCPLARILRKKIKELGIPHLKVVYSEEIPRTPLYTEESKGTAGRPAPGSVSFVPSVVGLILAGEVVKDLLNLN